MSCLLKTINNVPRNVLLVKNNNVPRNNLQKTFIYWELKNENRDYMTDQKMHQNSAG